MARKRRVHPKLIDVFGKEYIEDKCKSLPYGWALMVQKRTGYNLSYIRNTRFGLTGNYKIWKVIEAVAKGEGVNNVDISKQEVNFLRRFNSTEIVKMFVRYKKLDNAYKMDFKEFFEFVSRNPKLEGRKVVVSPLHDPTEIELIKRENDLLRHKLQLLGML